MSDFPTVSDMTDFLSADMEAGTVPQWSFSDRLRKAREYAGLDQEQLAALVAKKRPTISNWERGVNRPDALALRAIAHYTGVPLVWIEHGIEPGDAPDREPVTIGYLAPVIPLARVA